MPDLPQDPETQEFLKNLERPKEEDQYIQYKKSQQTLEFLQIRENFIKEEMKNLKREMVRAKEVGASGNSFCAALITPHRK